MNVARTEIREESPSLIVDYASVPIAFEVRERLRIDVPESGLAGLHLTSERLANPYVKDYDAQPGNHPSGWAAHFDLTPWGFLSAWRDRARVGGAVIAWRTASLDLLDGRTDMAFLWDLRVSPKMRGEGVGSALFRAAEQWAASRGAQWLKVETQSVNVPACRFYARHGCTLGALNRFAYPQFPDEVQMMWYKRLEAGTLSR